jgi:hypothetical protein
MFLALNLVIIALILVACCFWLASEISAARLKKALDKSADKPLFQSQFKCVVINPCTHPCKQARAYLSKPILANNAPALPLQDCDAAVCECTFLPQEDRRMGVDRREKQDERRASIYANKRMFRDRRRASIQEFLLPKYRTFS